MLLSNCNIQDLVTEQINTYLSSNEFTFNELKEFITSKIPIPQVHVQCTKILSESKHADLIKVTKVLETQTYKQQITEDEKQTKQDLSEETKDDALKMDLTKELNQIPTRLTSHETECTVLKHKLARELASAPHVEVTHQHQTSTKSAKNVKKKSSSIEEHSIAIDRLNTSILHYEMKIQALCDRQASIRITLHEINSRAQARQERKLIRNTRSQARAGYQSTGEGLLDTLSPKNQAQLSLGIKNQRNALATKYSELIQDAQVINFAFFLGLLQNHLNTLKLTAQEEEALRIGLKLMNQHLQYEQQSSTLKDSLNKKKQSISTQIVKLNDLNSKLKKLQHNNPNLSENNKKLTANNKELKTALEHNNALRQRLATPGLLLLTLSFLLTIPLILTSYGIIPFFIAPVFLFILVSAPPAFLLIATLSVGIAALVYGIKAHFNETAIQSNVQAIQTNNTQAKRNSISLQTLNTATIPAIESQIKKDELARDNLITSLKESQRATEQTLKQAKATEPVSYASSTLLPRSPASSALIEDPDLVTSMEQTYP